MLVHAGRADPGSDERERCSQACFSKARRNLHAASKSRLRFLPAVAEEGYYPKPAVGPTNLFRSNGLVAD